MSSYVIYTAQLRAQYTLLFVLLETVTCGSTGNVDLDLTHPNDETIDEDNPDSDPDELD